MIAIVVLLAAPVGAFAAEEATSPLGGPLALGGEAEVLAPGGAQLAAEAQSSSPEAFWARESSQTAYEGLSVEAGGRLALEAFPALVGRPAGGVGWLPPESHVTGYADAHVADVEMPGGELGLVQSAAPLAVRQPDGSWAPIDLAPFESNGHFATRRAAVPVSLPKDLSKGVGLPQAEVSLTPLSGSGADAAGAASGSVDGGVVFWGNTSMGSDVDAMARLTPDGVDLLAMLASDRSPHVLRYRVGMPEGATLDQAVQDGPVQVQFAGQTLAVIAPPDAKDAEGTPVPVSMAIEDGDVLTVSVNAVDSEHRMPIMVDPEIKVGEPLQESWYYTESESAKGNYAHEVSKVYESAIMKIINEYKPYSNEEWGAWSTVETKGDSKIFKVGVSEYFNAAYAVKAWEALERPGVEYVTKEFPASVSEHVSLCAEEPSCSATAGAQKNAARFEMNTTAANSKAELFDLLMEYPELFISEPAGTHATVAYNTASPEVEKNENVMFGAKWMGPVSGAFEYVASDAGLGVAAASVEVEQAGKWTPVISHNWLYKEGKGSEFKVGCEGVQCSPAYKEVLTYAMVGKYVKEGSNHIRVAANDPMAGTSSIEHGEGEATLRVDTIAPHGFSVTGLASKENEAHELEFSLGEIPEKVRAYATDGEGAVESSGVRSLELAVDGNRIGAAAGSCAPGPCTASAEWTLNGRELGVGFHTLTVQAFDKAGNLASKSYVLEVDAASPVGLGPGSVNPQSGDYALEVSDVGESGGMSPLAVTRHYDSLNPSEGAEGPLGPQWTISLGSLASLEVLPDGSVMVVGPEGLSHFNKAGSSFKAPPGDSNLTLTFVEKNSKGEAEYLLQNKAKGETTRFTLPEGAKSWMPTVSEGPVATDTMTDSYKTVEVAGKKIVEPTLELAPHPTANCSLGKLERGCRALEFNYAEATTATGEAESEWGDYKGFLTRVYFTAWSAAEAKMKTVEVARYQYDSKGRLRAEWNPSVEPALKTVYGYDSEGHLTSLTPAGQQGWAFIYGASAADENVGRLLKVTRAQPQEGASEAEVHSRLLEQLTVEKPIELPALTGTPAQGVRMAVSTGKWTGSPMAYGYQWQSCNSVGAECKPIPGATNPNYTPTASDVGHRLGAQVTAINGAGAITMSSVPSSTVVSTETVSYAVRADKQPDAITEGPDKNLWFTISSANVIGKMTSSGAVTEYKLPSETEPYAITAGPDGNLWFTEKYHTAFGKITTAGVYTIYSSLVLKVDAGSIAAGPDGDLWFTGSNALTGTGKVGKMTTAGEVTEYALPEGSEPGKITEGSDKNLWFTEKGSGKIAKITTSGSITEYALAAGSVPSAITAGPDGNLWFTDSKNSRIGKITTAGAITTYSLPANSEPISIAAGADKDLWFTEHGSKKIGKITTAGAISEYTRPEAGEIPAEIVTGPASDLWFTEQNSEYISKLNPTPTAGASVSPQAGSTVEYNVPLSGSGLPAMTSTAVSKWGQKDVPVYAAAIFPPEEPQGWPAAGDNKATIYYIDAQARTVNASAPSGGIATSEYNESNEVVRTLSADNRAKALKESEPIAASKRLDTESTYNTETGELTETTGPEHTVKLPNGEEVSARNHVRYFYDEGAPQGEEYGLVTRTTDGALLSNGEEKDLRTTLTGYSGQSGLGWKLREPTSTTVDPSGLGLTSETVYNKETGAVTETRSPVGSSEAVYPPSLSSTFAGTGSGNGQLSTPHALAFESSTGSVWAADTANNRIEQFLGGKFQAAFGGSGSGNGQFSSPWGVATATGTVYVADTGNNRVQELKSNGEYVRQWGSKGTGTGQFEEPKAVAVDASGNVWVSDTGNNRVQEFTANGEFVRAFGSKGTGNGRFEGPGQIAFSGGMVYVVDEGNKRVQEFTPGGLYVAQFGAAGAGQGQFEAPWGITAAPVTGDLYVSDVADGRVQQFSPGGKFLAEFGRLEGLEAPAGVAAGSQKVYVADQKKNQITSWQVAGAGGARMRYLRQWGSEGAKEGQFSGPDQPAIDASGNLWVTDYANNRVEKFSKTGEFLLQFGQAGTGNGQFKGPTGVAVNQSTGNIYVADREDGRIEQFTQAGEYVRQWGSAGAEPGQLSHPGDLAIDSSGNVWVADTGNNRIQEFSSTGSFIAAYGSKGTSNGQFEEPQAIAFSGENLYVTDAGNHRVQELTSTGEYVRKWGGYGTGSGQFYTPDGIAADAAGNLYVTDNGQGRVQEFSATGGFLASFAAAGAEEGQLEHPEGIAITAAGDAYVADTGNDRIQEWMPERQAVHDTQTIYYTPGGEAGYPACENHPEWASLPCRTKPAGQPEAEGLPQLPVTTIERYNMYDQAEMTTEAFGSTTRTKSTTFDQAGRPITASVSASVDTPLPTVTDRYSTETGALVEESTESGGKTETISSAYNTLGQLTKYTDAAGNTTSYSYDPYNRLSEVNYSTTELDGLKATQKYAYNTTTGALSELKDSAAGAFKPSYDVEGNLTSETYPNGMTASYTYNSIGEATSLVYMKTSNCTENCTWFTDTLNPSVHGQMMSQRSSLANEQYSYDAIGRLTQVQETPAGEGCTTRLYAYDEESNRTSLTTRQPATEGKCAAEGGELQHHTYDEANRLTDEGITYDKLGNITHLPIADAGGTELTSSYYADGQLEKQTQGSQTNSYQLDPEGRTLKTTNEAEGKISNFVSHYAAGGGTPSWTVNETTGVWTRQITGIGGLIASQEDGHEAVLQIADLQGNIIGTASLSTTATTLLTTERSTEFGVPTTSKPVDKYNWLGTAGISTELSAGSIAHDGTTYTPQIGQPLQTQGAAPPQPRNQYTPYVATLAPWIIEGAAADAAHQTTLWEEAQRKTEEAEALTGDEEWPDPEKGKNTHGCKIKAYWAENVVQQVLGKDRFLGVGGEFQCEDAVYGFEIQLEIQWIVSGKSVKGGVYRTEGIMVKEIFGIHELVSSGKWAHDFACTPGREYRIWMFGRYWYKGGYTPWSATTGDGHRRKCEEVDSAPTPP